MTLRNVDTRLIDQTVRNYVKGGGASDMAEQENSLIRHLAHSKELMKLIDALVRMNWSTWSSFASAISMGMEIGYELGVHEAQQGQGKIQ